MIEYLATADDVSRVRFSLSPLGETVYSFRMLASPTRRGMHQPWVNAVRLPLRRVDFALLRAVVPPVGYIPDFLTPPPQVQPADFATELEMVRATAPESLIGEVEWLMNDSLTPLRWRAANVQLHRQLVADPGQAIKSLVELLAAYWQLAVEPYWAQLNSALRSDVHSRTKIIENSGVAEMFSSLHRHVGWQNNRLAVQTRYEFREKLDGQGLVLVPSLFCGPEVLTMVPPMQPMVVYPRPGAAEFWHQPTTRNPNPLASLLGGVRAAVLEALVVPTSTTELAARLGVTPGAVSQHLGVLTDCGLVKGQRTGRRVVYSHTATGEALVVSANPRVHAS